MLFILFLAACRVQKVLLVLSLPSWSGIGRDCSGARRSMARQFEESEEYFLQLNIKLVQTREHIIVKSTLELTHLFFLKVPWGLHFTTGLWDIRLHCLFHCKRL